MTTGGAARPGAALRCVLGLVLLACGPVTACAASDARGGPAADTRHAEEARRAASGAPSSPVAQRPEDLCTRIVAHWSREVLDSGTYGDYQSMGLSNGQYDILRRVVDRARAARERDGPEAAGRIVDREARRGCAARYRDGGPSEGPWQ